MMDAEAENAPAAEAIRVLVVDDARYMRRTLVSLLRQTPGIEVVGEAVDGRDGLSQFERLRPDVICLDIDMPEMNGITALKHVMTSRPTPVIIVSSMTDRDHIPFEVARLGVLDFFPKPSSLAGDLAEQTQRLLHLLRSAGRMRAENVRRVRLQRSSDAVGADEPCRQLIVVAGTLGSTCGLISMLRHLRPCRGDGAAFVGAAALHPAIRESFLASVHDLVGWRVAKSLSRERLRSGVAYFPPMDSRMNIRNGEIELTPAPEADIDVLFTTAAREFGERAVCVLLAGDESRGFEGLEEAASMGAACFAQDERTALFESWKPKAAGSVRLMEIERIAKVVRRRLSAGGPRKPMERDS